MFAAVGPNADAFAPPAASGREGGVTGKAYLGGLFGAFWIEIFLLKNMEWYRIFKINREARWMWKLMDAGFVGCA